MRLREVLLLIAVGLSAGRAGAQPLPELPPPRPVAPGQSLPELPPPRPVPSTRHPPMPPLVRQALESNFYRPVCEPETPTYGLWGPEASAYPRSWQECWMGVRDCLAWICTRPTCAKGMRPPANASLFDWLCDRAAYYTSSRAAWSATHTIRIMAPVPPSPHN